MRTVEQIDEERAKLQAEEEGLKLKLRALQRERDQALIAAELAAMPEGRVEALRAALIGPEAIPSAEAMGVPGRGRR